MHSNYHNLNRSLPVKMKSAVIQVGQFRIPIIYIDVSPILDQVGGRFFCTTVFGSFFRSHSSVLPVGPSDHSVMTAAYSRAAVEAMAITYGAKWPLGNLVPETRPCTDVQVAGHQGQSNTIYLPQVVFQRVLDALVSATFIRKGKPSTCDLPGLLAAQEQLGTFFRSLSGMLLPVTVHLLNAFLLLSLNCHPPPPSPSL
jgi:hypothetical protein